MLSDALARAFLDDPVTRYLLPDDRIRYRALLPFYRAEMRATQGRVTTRCDAEGLGAYLESSKTANVAYYERFGFRVTGELAAPDGPTVWMMWRDPQVPGTQYNT